LFQAKIFDGGQAWVTRDPSWMQVKDFWQPFVIQPETPSGGVFKRFGKYSPGWPLLLAIGTYENAPWIVNAWIAALVVVVIYRIGREIFDEAVGIVAALLMAISPMALILNGTLMSHPSALLFTMLFVYCYWRTTRTNKAWRSLILWGIGAGLSLGWVVAERPLTALAMAVPVGLHILSRLVEAASNSPDAQPRRNKRRSPDNETMPARPARPLALRLRSVTWVFIPALAVAIGTLPTAALYPWFNYEATGNPTTNLYALQWSYDVVGFGPGTGLMDGGHTLEYGLRNARTDLAFWFRDLYGWTLSTNVATYAADNLGWGAGIGVSWIVIVFGLIAGRKKEWIWLLFELFVALVIAQMFYWIGSVVYDSAVYSVRYYYEGTGGIVLVSAFGVVAFVRALRDRSPLKIRWPLRFMDRVQIWTRLLWPGYVILIIAVALSLIKYTPQRFAEPLHDWPNGLYRYNTAGQQQIDALNAARDPGKPPVLVIILNNANGVSDDWRDYGALLAATSPYLNSDIVVARVFDEPEVADMVRHFPGRQVLYEVGDKFYRTVDAALGRTTAHRTGILPKVG